MLKILITDIVDDYLIQTLSANGCQINYQKNISQSEVEHIISEYDGIIITTKISLLKNTLSNLTDFPSVTNHSLSFNLANIYLSDHFLHTAYSL